jgi:tRNA(fMet)-specific endonuclease VapC
LTYLLDSNVLIQVLRGRPDGAGVRSRLHITPRAEVGVCSIVRAELLYGALRLGNTRRIDELGEFLSGFASIAVDDRVADVAASIRNELAAKRLPIGPYDVLIAATALAHGLTLVTHNTAEFLRVHGLKVEDWQTA